MPIIIGVVLGAVVLLAVGVVVIFVLRRRSKPGERMLQLQESGDVVEAPTFMPPATKCVSRVLTRVGHVFVTCINYLCIYAHI